MVMRNIIKLASHINFFPKFTVLVVFITKKKFQKNVLYSIFVCSYITQRDVYIIML